MVGGVRNALKGPADLVWGREHIPPASRDNDRYGNRLQPVLCLVVSGLEGDPKVLGQVEPCNGSGEVQKGFIGAAYESQCAKSSRPQWAVYQGLPFFGVIVR